ncbi:MAG TPA: histidine phosphatase family protein [Candidatus Limnocylindrales bacterium]|nr:histidine phosphatase family protein [Candidatus Limnocylindrales bacterium]
MLTLVLTRHGLTDRSDPEQHLGQRIDVSVNDAGRRQAEALARRLSAVRFDRVVTSPLFRARETAEIIGRGAKLEADPRLKEMDYGDWEGLTYAQIEERAREARREWELAPDRLACPGGESGNDVADRVRSFLDDLIEEHRAWHAKASFRAATAPGGPAPAPADRPVLAVGHSSTNRVLLCVALGTDVRDYRKRFVQGQANLTVLRWEDGEGPSDAKLIVGNDLGHLRGPDTLPWE